MKQDCIIICFLIFLSIKSNSQIIDYNLDDVRKKYPIELYFIPVGVNDINHASEIEKVLSENNEIGLCKIYKNEKSKIFAVKEINIEAIKAKLKSLNISILNDFIYIKDNYFFEANDPNWKPKSFPKLINTGNSKDDEARFSNDVEKWKSMYKAEYEKMLLIRNKTK